MKFISKPLARAGLVAAVAAAVTQANAAPPVLTSLTDAVDFSTAGAAVLAVGAALIVVYITIKAAGFVIGMVRRG
jgi:uncharacterized membrane protein required for colicin V production